MYGAKVSRTGFDVNIASDRQLAFSSQWPLLPIEAEGTFDAPSDTYDEVIFTHNLGYVPAFMIWEENSGKLYQGGKILTYNVYATTTTLHLEDFIFEDCIIHWKIFARPLLVDYTSDSIISVDATEKDSGDYGIVVSLPGKEVSSMDKRDFGVRSDVRQLMIHKSGYVSSTYDESVSHGLNYRPMYLLYVAGTGRNPAGAYSLLAETDDFAITVTTTELSWYYAAEDAFDYAFIIFKDPINTSG